MDYVAVLQELVATCKYTEQEYNQIRHRLLHGCNNEDMQLEMVKVGNDMTYETALDAALKYESVGKSVKEMSSQSSKSSVGSSVHKVSAGGGSQGQGRCWRCGGQNHKQYECKFKTAKCFLCDSIGHIKNRCPRKEHASTQN